MLREQPSIQSINTFKLSRVTKVLRIESKGIWQKVEAGENQGWLLCGQLSKIPVKRKKLILGQKFQLHSASGRRLRLRTFTAVVGVRGLLDNEGNKVSPYQTDYLALEWLENLPSDENISVIAGIERICREVQKPSPVRMLASTTTFSSASKPSFS